MATVSDVVVVLLMVNILVDVLGKVYLLFSLIELAFPALAIVVFGGLVSTRSWEGRLADSFESFELRDGLNLHGNNLKEVCWENPGSIKTLHGIDHRRSR